MKRSKQFPTKVRIKDTDMNKGTLLYTFPLTGITKAVSGCIGVPYHKITTVMKDMVAHGYNKDCFSKPVYHKSHENLDSIK